MRLVVDASVVVLALIRSQPEWPRAVQVLDDFADGRIALLSPGLLVCEVTNALDVAWRRLHALDEEDAADALDAFLALRVDLTRAEALATEAFAASKTFGISAYDGAYVALARELGVRLVSADRRLLTRLGSASGIAYPLADYATPA